MRKAAHAGLAGLVVTLLALPRAGGVTAQKPYPPGAAATCPTSQVAPGEQTTCSAAGFAAGSPVQVQVRCSAGPRTLTGPAAMDRRRRWSRAKANRAVSVERLIDGVWGGTNRPTTSCTAPVARLPVAHTLRGTSEGAAVIRSVGRG